MPVLLTELDLIAQEGGAGLARAPEVIGYVLLHEHLGCEPEGLLVSRLPSKKQIVQPSSIVGPCPNANCGLKDRMVSEQR